MPIAVVTGASRGVGRGAATGLAEQGYRVIATGRTVAAAELPKGIERVSCDHLHDDQTAAAFARAAEGLDVLVNSAWGGYEQMSENGQFTWPLPFWEQPLHRWTSMMDTGVRAAFVAASHAARIMIPQKRGLIVNISHWAAQKHIGNTIYGISKAATDKMTADMAHELRPHGILHGLALRGLLQEPLRVDDPDLGIGPRRHHGGERRGRHDPSRHPTADRTIHGTPTSYAGNIAMPRPTNGPNGPDVNAKYRLKSPGPLAL